MKTVNEFAGFAAAVELQTRLESELQKLQGEHAELLGRLNFQGGIDAPVPDSMQRAKAMLEGKPMPGNKAAAIDELRGREFAVREQIEVIGQALRQQPDVVEAERRKARHAFIEESKKDVAAIQGKWLKAVAAVREALNFEDEFLAQLLVSGFGDREARIYANTGWLNKELLPEVAA